MNPDPAHLQRFGRCSLDPEKKVLWCDDEPVPLPLKAVELLSLLVAKRGEVVTKDEIWHGVWQDAFVEDSNLTHNIYLLRKTFKELGEPDLIQTVPRRGYRFTGRVDVPSNGDLVIERHSLTRTLIEEIGDGHVSAQKLSSPRRGQALMLFVALPLAAVLIAGAVWILRTSSGDGSVAGQGLPKSLAILPLQPLEGGSEETHLGPGLTESLISRLGSLPSIVVRPNESVKRLLEEHADPVTIGREVSADAVLTGSYQRVDGRIRISMRLINVADGAQLWAGNFDEPESDIFHLQDVLSAQVAESLVSKLSPHERESIAKRHTESREAYEAYLLGRAIFDKRDPAMFPSAIHEFQTAIELDPKFALAYAGLADVYAMQAGDRGGRKDEVLIAKAKDALLKALSLDDELAEAHTSLALLERGEWDWEEAEREFKRSIELNPNYYNARMWYALLLLTLDRKDEALVQIEKAKELAPLVPSVIANYYAVRFFRQENDQLLAIAEHERKLGARDYATVRTHSQIYLRLREYAKVIEIVNDFYTRNSERRYNTLDANLAAAYGLSGQMKLAHPIIRRLQSDAVRSTEAGYRLATVLVDLGRYDEALALLENCAAERDDRLLWIKVEPRFDPVRTHPRFIGVLKKMNLLGDFGF